MPYRDPEDRRRYDRERKRGLRAASRPGVGPVPPPVRLRVAADVEALLAEAVDLVRGDPKARGTERARALGYLASIALRLIETHDLQDRLESLERVLALRSEAREAA